MCTRIISLLISDWYWANDKNCIHYILGHNNHRWNISQCLNAYIYIKILREWYNEFFKINFGRFYLHIIKKCIHFVYIVSSSFSCYWVLTRKTQDYETQNFKIQDITTPRFIFIFIVIQQYLVCSYTKSPLLSIRMML